MSSVEGPPGSCTKMLQSMILLSYEEGGKYEHPQPFKRRVFSVADGVLYVSYLGGQYHMLQNRLVVITYDGIIQRGPAR